MEGHNQRQHHIVQTIVGPVCMAPSCLTRVSNNNTLFGCDKNTIKRHWKKNQCFLGSPSARKTARELLERLCELHRRSINNKELAFHHFKEGDDGVNKNLRYHCSHCGLVDKRSKLNSQHKCPGKPIKAYVLSNKYNQRVPESFLNDIVDHKSLLHVYSPEPFAK